MSKSRIVRGAAAKARAKEVKEERKQIVKARRLAGQRAMRRALVNYRDEVAEDEELRIKAEREAEEIDGHYEEWLYEQRQEALDREWEKTVEIADACIETSFWDDF